MRCTDRTHAYLLTCLVVCGVLASPKTTTTSKPTSGSLMTSKAVDQLHSRARSLADQFERGGESRCIEEAIKIARLALERCPAGHPERSVSLTWLALHLNTRYGWLGDIEDTNEAMSLDHEALQLRPPGNPERGMSLNNLGLSLSSRYNRLGRLDDHSVAITLGRHALLLCPPGHPDRSMSLNNLAADLSSRYNRLGAFDDLQEAITYGCCALLLRPSGHPDRSSSLNNLGLYLSSRYNRLGRLDDLDDAITLGRDTLLLRPPGHPDRSTSLNNLGLYLYSRYNRLGGPNDLDEAIMLSRGALLLRPPGHPLRSSSLNNLGLYLSSRYSRLGRLDDLDEAVTLGRDALLLCPPGHPRWPYSLHSLASRLSIRYTKLRHEVDQKELFTTYIQLSDVQQTASFDDLEAARAWIREAEHSRHFSTLLAYQTAFRFLVHHLSTLPALPQHLTNIKNLTSSLAVDAFSACIRNHNLTHAVELLEQGRGIFWGQLARLNSSHELADLATSGPVGKTYSDEFTRVTSLIRSAGPHQHDQVWMLNVKLQAVISEIRRLPRFSRFLLPPAFSDLQQAASGGPIIVVNASTYSCDALIVLIDRYPVHVPLSAVTKETARDLSSRLCILTMRAKFVNVSQEIGAFLRELWDRIVSPIVDVLRTVIPLRSRIWWCPTAEFAFLPLHAAGPCEQDEQSLPDLYVSSYTPTLSALIRARRPVQPKPETRTTSGDGYLVPIRPTLIPLKRRASNSSSPETEIKRRHRITGEATSGSQENLKHIDMPHQKPGSQKSRFVAIGQGNAIGEKGLKSVADELTGIGRLLDGLAVFTRIEGPQCTVSGAIDEFGKNEWVHLACHGVLDENHPFYSAFALHDDDLTIERIIRCELDNPEFAYLSACHTTVGDKESPDEALHLAAAMQFVGFRSVIGTMWSVDDDQTTTITSTFYRHLIGDSGRLDYTRAALALNLTMKELTGIVPSEQRILYVHIGA